MKVVNDKNSFIFKNIKINLEEHNRESFIKFFEEHKTNKKYFRRCGSGVNRIVYKFEATDGKNYVIKKTKEKKIQSAELCNQNKNEIKLFKSVSSDEKSKALLAPILLDYSNSNYLIMESASIFEFNYLKKEDAITKELKEWLDSFENFKGKRIPFNNIFMACSVTNMDFNEFVLGINRLSEYGLDLEDLYLSNLGELNGRLVILDYGLLEQKGEEDDC